MPRPVIVSTVTLTTARDDEEPEYVKGKEVRSFYGDLWRLQGDGGTMEGM